MQFKKEAIDKLKAHGEQVAKALKDYMDFMKYSPLAKFTKEEDLDLPADEWEKKYAKELALANHIRDGLHKHLILTIHETGRYEILLKNEVKANHWSIDADNWGRYIQYFHQHIEKPTKHYPKNPLQWAEDEIKSYPNLSHVLEGGKSLKEYTSKWIDEHLEMGEVLPPGQLLVLYLQYLQDCVATFYATAEEMRPAKESKEVPEIIEDVPGTKSPRTKLLIFHELGLLKPLRDSLSYMDDTAFARLFCLVAGLDTSSVTSVRKGTKAILYGVTTSKKDENPINRDSVRDVEEIMQKVKYKVKNLPSFDD